MTNVKSIIISTIVFLFIIQANAQVNTIQTAVPFLTITPDARAAGMGETGVATSPDVNSIHWNPAKPAFSDKKFALGISYTPWYRTLVPDANHAYISSYFKPDSVSAIGVSMRYFSMGMITLMDTLGNVIGQYRPNEFAFDASYSRQLAKYWSGGIAVRYIYSDVTGLITIAGQDTRPGRSIAADLAVYYHDNDRVKIFGKKSTMMMGMAITNIGSKMRYSYSDTGNFIPINLRVGQGATIHLDSKNDLAIQYEFNKLLVPSPQANGLVPNVSVPKGMVQSFHDAPGGFKEELAEITFSTGLEYSYNKLFFVRTGYFYEAPTKGNRQFITLGAGVKYNIFGLDFAYLIPTNGQRSPLQNTLRFTLLFDMSKLQLHQMKIKDGVEPK